MKKMKKRWLKHGFNMVEVALALAVLAIGISSILVLFPVGINANKSAIADNNLADIGEYLMGYLRAGCAAAWASGKEEFITDIPVGYDTVKSFGSEGIDLSKYEDSGLLSGKNLHKLDGNGAFLYQQMTGDVVDFAAVVRVWREAYSFKALDASKYTIEGESGKANSDSYADITVTPGSSEPINKYATVFCIEISYPAQAPDSQRERRLFRQEIFNETYRY